MAADGTPMTAEILEIVHDALNLHPGTAEIQKKADGKSRSAEVVDALGSRSLFQVDLRFQLDQYARFNKQVSHVRADDFSLVPDVQRPLLFDGEAASPQLHAQSILVDLLEEAHAKYMAYTLPCPDDPSGQFIELEPPCIGGHRRAIGGHRRFQGFALE